MTDYEWLTQMGLCHKCRKQKTAPEKKFCFDCLDKIREDNKKRYDPEYAKAYQKRRRELYEEHKRMGICTRCSKKATHGLYCYEHSIKMRRRSRYNAEQRKRKRHERGLIPNYRKENGLCLFCGELIEPDNLQRGFLVCQKHREMAAENSKKAVNNPYRIATQEDMALMRAKNEKNRGI